MQPTILKGLVETSDQYGRSETILIGIFDDPLILMAARVKFRNHYRNYHHSLSETPVVMNEINLLG